MGGGQQRGHHGQHDQVLLVGDVEVVHQRGARADHDGHLEEEAARHGEEEQHVIDRHVFGGVRQLADLKL